MPYPVPPKKLGAWFLLGSWFLLGFFFVQQLWEHYFQQLVRLASKKLPANIRRAFDEEDVALSAFHSLCRGVQNDRFPKLEDRDNLWSLLVVITARKAMRRVRDEMTQKRGGGRFSGESVFLTGGGSEISTGINEIIKANLQTPNFSRQLGKFWQLLDAVRPTPYRWTVFAAQDQGKTFF